MRAKGRIVRRGASPASVFCATSRLEAVLMGAEAAVCDLRSGKACSQAQRRGRWPRHAERSTVGPRATACSVLGAAYFTGRRRAMGVCAGHRRGRAGDERRHQSNDDGNTSNIIFEIMVGGCSHEVCFEDSHGMTTTPNRNTKLVYDLT
ncbi:hypothetical protein VPH35_135802 [Triticum aestivum]